MKVLVTGSRTWTDENTIKQALLALDSPVEIIHGGAKGADRLADIAAINMSMKSTAFKPKYDKYPVHKAPLMRNLEMLDEKPDLVLAFQVGKSRGTQHTINHARKRGIPVKVYHDGQ